MPRKIRSPVEIFSHGWKFLRHSNVNRILLLCIQVWFVCSSVLPYKKTQSTPLCDAFFNDKEWQCNGYKKFIWQFMSNIAYLYSSHTNVNSSVCNSLFQIVVTLYLLQGIPEYHAVLLTFGYREWMACSGPQILSKSLLLKPFLRINNFHTIKQKQANMTLWTQFFAMNSCDIKYTKHLGAIM